MARHPAFRHYAGMIERVILFDIDGTLLRTAGVGRHALVEALLAVYDVDEGAAHGARVPFGGRTDPDIFREMAFAAGVARERYEPARERLFDTYLNALHARLDAPGDHGEVLPGVRELLDTLHRRSDVALGIVTGNIEGGARAKLRAFGLDGYFVAGGYGSDDADRRRVARFARDRTCEASGADVPPERVVVVGDTEHDVDCARANGYREVLVETGFGDRDHLARLAPESTLTDLGDLDASLTALGLSR